MMQMTTTMREEATDFAEMCRAAQRHLAGRAREFTIPREDEPAVAAAPLVFALSAAVGALADVAEELLAKDAAQREAAEGQAHG